MYLPRRRGTVFLLSARRCLPVERTIPERCIAPALESRIASELEWPRTHHQIRTWGERGMSARPVPTYRVRPKFEFDGGFSATRVPMQFDFPEPGQYTVQVWFFRQEGSDVLKGEIPFHVAAGGT